MSSDLLSIKSLRQRAAAGDQAAKYQVQYVDERNAKERRSHCETRAMAEAGDEKAKATIAKKRKRDLEHFYRKKARKNEQSATGNNDISKLKGAVPTTQLRRSARPRSVVNYECDENHDQWVDSVFADETASPKQELAKKKAKSQTTIDLCARDQDDEEALVIVKSETTKTTSTTNSRQAEIKQQLRELELQKKELELERKGMQLEHELARLQGAA